MLGERQTRDIRLTTKANAKIATMFVYSGEKDNKRLLSSIQAATIGENRQHTAFILLSGGGSCITSDTSFMKIWPSDQYPMIKGNAHGV